MGTLELLRTHPIRLYSGRTVGFQLESKRFLAEQVVSYQLALLRFGFFGKLERFDKVHQSYIT